MSKNLVIVESPAKAKTIEKFLGKDFIVRSSFGHVRDLPKDNNAIDIKNGFKPTYVISPDKKDVIAQLKKLVKEMDMVWLASDDDREGEAISWHLAETLNLDDAHTRRIVFHEITKKAIQNAIASPRSIDYNLVNAQQARRVLDRLVGFELSPVLWKKIKGGLSAGRVQSVAVRLVVEREREIERFQTESYFKISAIFLLQDGKQLKAELPAKLKTEKEAADFLGRCLGAAYTIANLEKKPAKKSPAPPFTTSTLQQEASRKLYFSVAQTMTVAQRLYEAGKISYMRTDSVNLSDDSIQAASRAITDAFGEKYVKTRKFKNKNQGAQEAHEAIRPTDFSVTEGSSDRNEQRLYDLIWKRAIASQMADAELEKTTATIAISTTKEQLIATGEVVKFDGFLKVYTESADDESEDEETSGMLPPLNIGQVLNLDKMLATQRYSRPPARFTEASLVKQLEEMGIGRPSTYAPTISTVQKRGYVEKDNRDGKARPYTILTLAKDKIVSTEKTEMVGAEKNKLFPTDTAMVVNDFLVEHFPNVVDFNFTAKVEEEFDKIAAGQEEWVKMLSDFYKDFHEQVENTDSVSRTEANKARLVGNHPQTGQPIYAKLGKFGPYVQLGDENDGTDKKPTSASLQKGMFMEQITLDEALELFKLPRTVGTFEDKEMVAALGRFGPYIRHDGKFYSLTIDLDPLTVNEEEAIKLILNKRKADEEKYIKTFPENPDIQVLKGRYGPYISAGKKNVKIPKDKDPASLTLEECLALAEATPEKKGGRGATSKAPAKKPAAKKPAAKKPAAGKK